MKRKLTIALALALLVTFAFSVPAFAYDYEDPEVANNADFWNGNGWDDDIQTTHVGEQHPNQSKIADGYNLYRDDVTDSGNLDRVRLRTDTPDLLDLPGASLNWKWAKNDLGWMCKVSCEGADTWYWALAPRGYNRQVERDWFTVVLPDGKLKVRRFGTIRHQDIDFSDGTWQVQIPARVQIWVGGTGNGAADKLILNDDGSIWNSIKVLGGDITITKV